MKMYIINLNLGFLCNLPGGTMIKNPSANAGDAGLILVSRRSPGRGNGNPLFYAWNPLLFMPGKYHARGTWWAAVHGIAKSQTRLSNWECTRIHLICPALVKKSDPFVADPSTVIISSDPDTQEQMILSILCNWHWGYHINDSVW